MLGTLPGMKCSDCLRFEKAYYYRAGDMPDSPHGFCNAGSTPIERGKLIRETNECRYDPPRFVLKVKS